MDQSIENFVTQESSRAANVMRQRISRIAPDQAAFRSRLRELIREAGSEAELDRRAGLPLGALSHYTRSRPSEPGRPYLVAIAAAGNVRLDWLCAGHAPKREYHTDGSGASAETVHTDDRNLKS